MKSSGSTGRWLSAIVLLGAALRLFPIWFGLPYPWARPDEEVAVGIALTMLGGDLNPHFFHWPSLTFYTFAALFGVVSWIARLLSFAPLDGNTYLLIARALVATAGTATIAVTYLVGRRVADARTGLVAALFLSVAVLHVRDSHFAMTDVLMTLLVTASLALVLRAVDAALAGRAPHGWFAAAGLIAGLAASTKYSAAAIGAAMIAAQIVLLVKGRVRALEPRAWAPSLLFGAGFGMGFVAGTPYAVLDYAKFEEDFWFTVTHLSAGHGIDLGRGWTYHFLQSLPHGAGVAVFAAALAGLFFAVGQHGWPGAIVVTYAIAFYVSIGSGQTVFFRYVLPLVPIVCVLAAVAVRRAADALVSRTGLRASATLAIVGALVAAPSAWNSVRLDLLLARTDTRLLAGRWLETQLTPESTLHDAGGPSVQIDLRHVRFHQWYFDPGTKSFGHPEGKTPEWLVFYDSPLRLYGRPSPELRGLAQRKYALVQVFPAMKRRSRFAVYDRQDAFFLPISGFGGVERPGPTVLIYRRVTP